MALGLKLRPREKKHVGTEEIDPEMSPVGTETVASEMSPVGTKTMASEECRVRGA